MGHRITTITIAVHKTSHGLRCGEVVEGQDGPRIRSQDSCQEGKVYVDDAQVMATDIKAGNGVIHMIDSVIL